MSRKQVIEVLGLKTIGLIPRLCAQLARGSYPASLRRNALSQPQV